MILHTVPVKIYDGDTKPPDRAHVFVFFDNGFSVSGFYHERQDNLICGAGTYMFTGVKCWFSIPNEVY